MKTPQDLRHLDWSEAGMRASGLGGARPKAREGIGPGAVYYVDLSQGSPRGVRAGLAQLVCCRVMEELGVAHVPFELVRAVVDDGPARWVVRTRSLRSGAERAMPLEMLWEMDARAGESPLDYCLRRGWGGWVADLAVADYLCAVRDRDASTLHVIASVPAAPAPTGSGSAPDAAGPTGTAANPTSPATAFALNLEPAPIAPRANSLVNAFPRNAWRLDPLGDLEVESFLGDDSLEANLRALAARGVELRVPDPAPGLRRRLMGDLADVAPDDTFLEACWTIVKRRWEALAHLRGL